MKDRTRARKTFLSTLTCAGALAAGTIGTGQAQTAPSATKSPTKRVANRTEQHPPDTPASLPAATIATANNTFGFRLFQEISKKGANVNVCISPTSIALALAMTYNGANGTTKTAMAHVLALEGMSLEVVNQDSQALVQRLSTPAPPQTGDNGREETDTTQLTLANSLWLKRQDSLLPDFIQRTQRYYDAQLGSLQGAPDNINAWVSQHTQGKITHIVNAGDVAEAAAVLVNAVSFKGQWNRTFYKPLTKDKPFHRAGGKATPCKMMTQYGHYDYYKGDTFQMVSLPYQSDRMEMVIVLPDAHTPLSALVSRLTPEHWKKWTQKMTRQEGTVQLPRFRAEYGVELKEALSTLGMGEAFGPGADFSAMSHGPFYIGKVLHRTFVNVNEQGTEAAAVTVVTMAGSALSRETPFEMIVDRPFLYAICDRQTGALLFLGTLAQP